MNQITINLDDIKELVETSLSTLEMAEKIDLSELVDPPEEEKWEQNLATLRARCIDCQKILHDLKWLEDYVEHPSHQQN